MSEPSPDVVLIRRGGALWARINRPDRANACGPGVMDGLESWLRTPEVDPSVRVLVLTGTGTAFCAGADMRFGAELADPEANLAFVERGRNLVSAVSDAVVPVIAAVNGVAFAGGFELVQAADLVIAVRGTRLGDRHIRYGIVPGWGSTARLPRLVGQRAATRLLLTGVDLDADELARLGLVTEVVEPEALESTVDALAEQLAGLDPAAVARVLRLCRESLRGTLAEALDGEWAAAREHLLAASFTDSIDRFLER